MMKRSGQFKDISSKMISFQDQHSEELLLITKVCCYQTFIITLKWCSNIYSLIIPKNNKFIYVFKKMNFRKIFKDYHRMRILGIMIMMYFLLLLQSLYQNDLLHRYIHHHITIIMGLRNLSYLKVDFKIQENHIDP